MLSVSNQQMGQVVTKKLVSFSPEVYPREEQRAIREDKKKMDTLILQCSVVFVYDKPFALKLFQEAKFIADKRLFTDEGTALKLSSQEKTFKRYGYAI